MGSIPIARSSLFVSFFMFSCQFLLTYVRLSSLNEYIDELDISNISIFENQEFGFLDDVDECGFKIAKIHNVEIFQETEAQATALKIKLLNKFPEVVQSFKTTQLQNNDWIELYTQELQPIVCGDFYCYNDALQPPPVGNVIPIKLSSALAFGTGHHETTKACLCNLDWAHKSHNAPKNVLDMGAGTGILGICAKKLWPNTALLGIDIDKDAVDIAVANYHSNNIIGVVEHAKNVDELIQHEQEFDMIFCNILKQPLLDLCKDFWKILTPNTGTIITSGYIENQEDEVVSMYLHNNFEIVNKIYINEWVSIAFQKKSCSIG